MFEQENLADGVTLHVYRMFDPSDKHIKLSILPRIKNRVDEGFSVLNPIIQERKALLSREIEEHNLKSKGLVNKIKLFFDKKLRANLISIAGRLNDRQANPLFHLPEEYGKELLNSIIASLEGKGLKVVSREGRSNGEMNEEVIVLD